MHFILLVLGVIASLGFWYFRLKQAADAAREVKRHAEGVVNLPRKLRFKARAGKNGVALIDDPMEAGVAVMLGAAVEHGEPSARQLEVMIEQAAQNFRLGAQQAEELVRHIAWMLREEADIPAHLGRLSRLIRARAGEQALSDLVGMVDIVIRAEGAPDNRQRAYLASVLRAGEPQ